MALDTTYGPGFSKTTTGNYDVGSPGMAGGANLSGIARAIMAKKDADAARQRQNQVSVQALLPPPPGEEPSGADAFTKHMRNLELQKAQMAMRPAPMTVTHPWGSAGFYTQDPDAMSAVQRQMFLPQGSQQVGGFGPGATPTLPDEGPSLDVASNPAGTANDQFLHSRNVGDDVRRIAQMQALRGRG